MSDIRGLVENFINQLTMLVESQTIERARSAVEGALGVRRPGRPAKTLSLAFGAKARKKAPKQLCPVPGCKNAAAPVFGMVCADHKDVAKTKIKKYREARKAKKAGVKAAKPTKRAKRKAVSTRRKAAKLTKRKKVARPAPAATTPALAAA